MYLWKTFNPEIDIQWLQTILSTANKKYCGASFIRSLISQEKHIIKTHIIIHDSFVDKNINENEPSEKNCKNMQVCTEWD